MKERLEVPKGENFRRTIEKTWHSYPKEAGMRLLKSSSIFSVEVNPMDEGEEERWVILLLEKPAADIFQPREYKLSTSTEKA